jgi:hypothetical protein
VPQSLSGSGTENVSRDREDLDEQARAAELARITRRAGVATLGKTAVSDRP